MAAITSAQTAVVARPAFVGKTSDLRVRAAAPASKRASVAVFASAEEATSRRAALSIFSVSAPGSGRRGDHGDVRGSQAGRECAALSFLSESFISRRVQIWVARVASGRVFWVTGTKTLEECSG